MSDNVRVRFAPSPTGFPHLGSIRTALFNWLFARKMGGRFIVRIEDTDVERTVPGSVEAILEGLRWLGLDWDEGPEVGGDYGPYIQSQRLKYYQEIAERLVAQGDAYLCFCSTQRLELMRQEQAKRKQPPGYDRLCRKLSREECARYQSEGVKPVVRFKTPLAGENRFHDLIRDEVVFDNATLDDFVLLKSDGYPTYHLANIVDDHMMAITHVMRAEEWLSSVPRHMLIYRALGWEPPLMAHLPLILGTDRSKLSKRHGAVSIIDYREQGYLPDAMLNFLTLLGWSLDDKTEIIPREDLIKNFSIERISRTAAIFDIKKLDWMNGVYIRKLSPEKFFEAAKPFLMKDKTVAEALESDEKSVRQTMPLVQERVKVLTEITKLIDFFFLSELEYDTKLILGKNLDKEKALVALEASREKVEKTEPFDAAKLEEVFRALAVQMEMRTGDLFGAIRTAVTGREVSPPLFATMAVLGRDRCLKRIDVAMEKVKRISS